MYNIQLIACTIEIEGNPSNIRREMHECFSEFIEMDEFVKNILRKEEENHPGCKVQIYTEYKFRKIEI